MVKKSASAVSKGQQSISRFFTSSVKSKGSNTATGGTNVDGVHSPTGATKGPPVLGSVTKNEDDLVEPTGTHSSVSANVATAVSDPSSSPTPVARQAKHPRPQRAAASDAARKRVRRILLDENDQGHSDDMDGSDDSDASLTFDEEAYDAGHNSKSIRTSKKLNTTLPKSTHKSSRRRGAFPKKVASASARKRTRRIDISSASDSDDSDASLTFGEGDDDEDEDATRRESTTAGKVSISRPAATVHRTTNQESKSKRTVVKERARSNIQQRMFDRTSVSNKMNSTISAAKKTTIPSPKTTIPSPTHHDGEAASAAFVAEHGDSHASLQVPVTAGLVSDPFAQPPLDPYRRATASPRTFGALPGAHKYTPLEKQFVSIKSKYTDAVLAVEVGYKYKFFGNDAEIAGKVLQIMCYPNGAFKNASIPTQRLQVHVRRLVECGYKVGVVSQTETAALKKGQGSKSSAPFTRALTHMYTRSTMVGEELNNSDDAFATAGLGASNYLLCLAEHPGSFPTSNHRKTRMSVVAVSLTTGEIVYDEFDDDTDRSNLATRVTHIQPAEVLVSVDVSARTQGFLKHLSVCGAHPPRVEVLTPTVFEKRKDVVAETLRVLDDADGNEASVLHKLEKVLTELPEQVQYCAYALAVYLKDFHLGRVLELTSHARRFTAQGQHMHLNGATVANLELFRNSTDGSPTGSLFWVVNKTSTAFGARLLRQWLAKPLQDARAIRTRLDIVDALAGDGDGVFAPVADMLKKLPDLQRTITSIYYQKCSCGDLYKTLESFAQIAEAFRAHQRAMTEAVPLLTPAVDDVIDSLASVAGMLGELSKEAAMKNDKIWLFVDDANAVPLRELKQRANGVRSLLDGHGKDLGKLLQRKFEYKTVSTEEYLVELPKDKTKCVKKDWELINQTTKVKRYRTPFIIEQMHELAMIQETMQAEADLAWKTYLGKFASEYDVFRRVVEHLAELDCLLAFAIIAQQPNFCKPTILQQEETLVKIVNGRNPVVTALADDMSFVPNDTHLGNGTDGQRCYVITGPNMGGKSCYIRQVALMSIMAQVGCYVPADAATVTPLDAVYTRMGAEDNIFARESTFMHELNEASSILRNATRRSLVIMDELGRGTSTHDGVAIAYATCAYLLNTIQCLSLFVTHYPSLARLDTSPDAGVGNYHMSFIENEPGADDKSSITFLYTLVAGAAGRSYGLNVARLACIPPALIAKASKKSKELEGVIQQRSAGCTCASVLEGLVVALDAQPTSPLRITELYDQLVACHATHLK